MIGILKPPLPDTFFVGQNSAIGDFSRKST